MFFIRANMWSFSKPTSNWEVCYENQILKRSQRITRPSRWINKPSPWIKRWLFKQVAEWSRKATIEEFLSSTTSSFLYDILFYWCQFCLLSRQDKAFYLVLLLWSQDRLLVPTLAKFTLVVQIQFKFNQTFFPKCLNAVKYVALIKGHFWPFMQRKLPYRYDLSKITVVFIKPKSSASTNLCSAGAW